jgi:hypothetical protein
MKTSTSESDNKEPRTRHQKIAETRRRNEALKAHETGHSSQIRVKAHERLAIQLVRDLGVEEAMRRMHLDPNAAPLFSLDDEPAQEGEAALEPMPESHAEPPCIIWKPQQGSGVFGIMGDTHIPYHDVQAIKTAFGLMKYHGITGLCLNGDISDFYQLSKYQKLPGKRALSQEIAATGLFHKATRERFPDAEIIEQSGNHEERLKKWIAMSGNVIWGIPSLDIPVLLRLQEFGIRYAESGDSLSLGGLNVIHGDVLPGGGSINSARNLAQKLLTPVAVNHHHIVDTWEPVSRVDGTRKLSAYNVGCLCGKRVDYAQKSTFQHGCMIVEYTPTSFVATNYLIDGTTYKEIRR